MREKKWSYYETRLKIKSDKDESIESAIDTIIRERKKLERFIYRKPEFRNSLEPLNLHEDNYSGIIRLMLRASKS
ncbi:hypothetical protein AKJ50_02140 [candidate division MSBL1 archaeon SCGC-AAA382A13]|uniref:Uncharacterized protein n=1 Tax=candidate division MSBL1 archaeon SCGC-AAA382A13 TaxID=1698279 RepID=A0A133VE23_9EURY|nr:hypothetical protein AKJ50_02140 [candidate division MSBL1 archaeon SCGC-AAA382A13]